MVYYLLFWDGMHIQRGNHDKWFQNGEDIFHLPTNYIQMVHFSLKLGNNLPRWYIIGLL